MEQEPNDSGQPRELNDRFRGEIEKILTGFGDLCLEDVSTKELLLIANSYLKNIFTRYEYREDIPEEAYTRLSGELKDKGLPESLIPQIFQRLQLFIPNREEKTRMDQAIETARGYLCGLADEIIGNVPCLIPNLGERYGTSVKIIVKNASIIDSSVRVPIYLGKGLYSGQDIIVGEEVIVPSRETFRQSALEEALQHYSFYIARKSVRD